jgi:uncharacterized membrane protein YgcG
MAASNPKQPEREEYRSGRPIIVSARARPARRSRWIWIAIGVVILAVIGVIAYMALYNGGGGYGGGGSGGSGSGGSGSGGGGGYILFAFSADQARRLKERISAKRR